MIKLPLVITLILASMQVLAKPNKDPFKDFEIYTLENGMTIVLAPHKNAKNIKMKMVVGTGAISETMENLQANHLLEHMLFRDGAIGKEKTYMQIIEDAGGQVNAYVKYRETAYFTTIAADKVEWSLDLFNKMLFNRTFDKELLELAKSSIHLEIGKPFYFFELVGRDPIRDFYRWYFPYEGFYQKEFGVETVDFHRVDQRINVKNLKVQHIDEVYKNYYYPSNMTFYLAGNFEKQLIKSKIYETFGKVKKGSGSTVPPRVATKYGGDYISTSPSTSNVSDLKLGKKLYNVSALDAYIMDIYMEFVAHNLMIELRNKKGETYTAGAKTKVRDGFGYSYVFFDTPNEKYKQNRDYVEKTFYKDAIKKSITDKKIQDAIEFYLKQKYEIKDVDAKTLLRLGYEFFDHSNDPTIEGSPYERIKNISPSEFRESLNRSFTKDGDYIVLKEPPLLSEMDYGLIILFGIISGISLFSFFYPKSEIAQSIHWGQKTTATPGLVIEIICFLVFTVFLDHLITRPIGYFLEEVSFIQASLTLSTYILISLSLAVFTCIFMWILTRHPRKLLSTNEDFVISFLIFRNIRLPKNQIAKIELIGMGQKYTSWKYFLNRSFLWSLCWDWAFFKPMLKIEMQNGNSYFLSFWNSQELKNRMEDELHCHYDANQTDFFDKLVA